ncbi:MAG: amidohydrolase family protein [Planctomycetes bacterium]|nr:amidohydrolase family protein [Planctomycetota bacterium]
MRIRGRHYQTAKPVEVEISQAVISRLQAVSGRIEHVDRWPWIAPGWFDLQVNGHGGQEFCSGELTVDGTADIARRMPAFGVTRFCPTVTTERFDVLRHSLATIAAACDESAETSRLVAGVHLEGPYLSPQDGPRGAHPREHCRRPDWDEFRRLQDAAGGRIRLLTMSVEFDGSAEFVARVVHGGVVVAIGHTAADGDHIRAATDAGARLCTHLGNGAHASLPRHPNYLWDQLAEDRLSASLIVDGHHLPPAVVKTFVRAKTPGRCLLVSDMSGLAGLPPGRYDTNLCALEILDDGRLVIAGQRQLLAGASLPIGTGIAYVMASAGVDLCTAVDMASLHPAELLGAEPDALEVGRPANLVQFDLDESSPGGNANPTVRATIVGGEAVFGSIWVG